MLIFLTEPEEIHPQAIKELVNNGHTVLTKKKLSPQERKKIAAIFIKTYTQINQRVLSNFPNVKYILRAGIGLDNIDLKECQKRNIKVITLLALILTQLPNLLSV